MNNALLGFTFQKVICDKFNLSMCERAKNTFLNNYDKSLVKSFMPIVIELFDEIKTYPVDCTTFRIIEGKKECKYNFLLSDNSTLSIRTNYSGDKVAPREVGQAGFEKLNLYFSEIYGKRIENQEDIKKLIYYKIDEVLPIFFQFLFDSDYVVWIYKENDQFNYQLIKGITNIDIDYKRDFFTFTKDIENWVESTTLKYKGKSIAEIQVHKKRSFKFRFIMKNVIPLFISKQNTTETLGITAEKTICDIFKLIYPNNFSKRYSMELENQLYEIIEEAFRYIPTPVKHTGSLTGNRGGTSKCSYDFLLINDKTLSVKTNYGKMVCPPEVGQPNDKVCYKYFKKLTKENHIDKEIFKKMVMNNVSRMIPIYLEHLFDSDYLLRIYESNSIELMSSGYVYQYEIYPKNYGSDYIWSEDEFAFSKKTLNEWTESCTVYYKGLSLGEFQVHNNRNCFKFRFNFPNLIKILRS